MAIARSRKELSTKPSTSIAEVSALHQRAHLQPSSSAIALLACRSCRCSLRLSRTAPSPSPATRWGTATVVAHFVCITSRSLCPPLCVMNGRLPENLRRCVLRPADAAVCCAPAGLERLCVTLHVRISGFRQGVVPSGRPSRLPRPPGGGGPQPQGGDPAEGRRLRRLAEGAGSCRKTRGGAADGSGGPLHGPSLWRRGPATSHCSVSAAAL